MAVKTYRIAATTTNNSGDLVDGVDQAAATRTDGWTSAKIAATNASDFDAATKQASGTFAAASGKPAALIVGATCNAFGTTAPLNGTFAATAWTFTFAVRATLASSQAGRMRMRVYRSVNADGSGATEITGATQVGTTSSVLSTTADVTTVVTWSPGATINLNNEYLFFVLAWEITTAGGSNSADVQIRTGQSAAGSRLVTPDFVTASAVPIGRETSNTVVRGVTLSGTGTATPVLIGRETSNTIVSGVTLAATGAAPLPIGRVTSATAVYGASIALVGQFPFVGRVASSTTVRGVTLAPGPVTFTIGRRVAATTVRGVTLTGTGAALLAIGRRASATVVRGMYLASPFPVTDYTSRWDAANLGSLTYAGGLVHTIRDSATPVNDMTGAPDPEYGARTMNSILVPDYGGAVPGSMQAPLVTSQTVKTVFIVAQADAIGGIRPLMGGEQGGGFEIRAVDGAVQLVRNGVTIVVAHPTPIIAGVPFILSAVVDG